MLTCEFFEQYERVDGAAAMDLYVAVFLEMKRFEFLFFCSDWFVCGVLGFSVLGGFRPVINVI